MSMTKLTDEVDRIVVRLPDDSTLFSGPTYVPVAVDASELGSVPSLLENDAGIGFLAEYQLFARLCSSRALKTVGGELLVRGKPVQPEQYLRLWRKAIASAISPAQLFERRGWTLRVDFTGPLNDPAYDQGTSSWTDCPFRTYGGFRARFANEIERLEDGEDFLSLDLRLPGVAREAFCAQSLLTSVLGYQRTWTVELVLDQGRPPHAANSCVVAEAA